MVRFEENLGWALGGGIIVAGIGLHAHHLHPLEALGVLLLACVGGSIPDIDQNKMEDEDADGNKIGKESKPFQYITFFSSIVVSSVILYNLNSKIEFLWMYIVLFLSIFVVFYTGSRWLIKHTTKQGGVMHSIPFAVLCGELTYLIFISDYEVLASASERMPRYFAAAIFVGYIAHLLANEFHFREKKDNPFIGTAFVLYSDKRSTSTANAVLYLLVIVLFFAIKSQEVSFQSLLAMIVDLY